MKISTSVLAGALTAAALTFGATASDASITFGIKASTVNPLDGSVAMFAPQTVFGTNFGVALSSSTFSIIDPGAATPPDGSVDGQYKSPWNGTPDDNNPDAEYFSVGGSAQPSPQTVTFASAITGLTILLGSIDSYNSFTFNGTHTITGDQIAAALGLTPADASNGNYEETAVIRFQFQGPGGINSLMVTSGIGDTQRAAAEFAVAAVPLPAAGFLMLAGLGGLVASRKLRRRVEA
jgi:hypothetical protein